MIPRGRPDIGWSDLSFGVLRSFLPERETVARHRIESGGWIPARHRPAWRGHLLATLSVRSGFDLLLRTLALPPGSEILFSAATIPDLPAIVRAHGLIPIPVDLDPETLTPDPLALERAAGPAARVLVLAHLFGARVDFREAIDFAIGRGLLVVEDCAQAWHAGRFAGDLRSDVVMFSFGSIKTTTSLGGGLLRFRDEVLHERVRATLANDPLQPTGAFRGRLLRYHLYLALSRPAGMRIIIFLARLRRLTLDEWISAATRGFSGSELLPAIRQRPSSLLLSLLGRRLSRPLPRQLARRAREGRRLAWVLDHGGVRRPGSGLRRHSHWIFPVRSRDPDGLVNALRAEGFDATRGATRLGAVEPPKERPEMRAVRTEAIFKEVVFLPVYPQFNRAERLRMASALLAFERNGSEILD